MTTITASTTVGIDLNPAFYTSPVVIDAGVTVSNPGYPYAVYRHSGATTFFVIQNHGTITSVSGGVVYLGPGGSVTNAAGASIIVPQFTASTKDAVKVSGGAGTVVNAGSIAGGNGVDLRSGGSVTNAAASAYIVANGYGVRVSGGTGTVVNDGIIAGSTGVDLASGGSVTNATSAHINGIFHGVFAGNVVNDGSITGGVSLAPGGSITNAASAFINGIVYVSSGAGTVINDGTIFKGIDLRSGGSVTNAASAYITAGYGYGGVYVSNRTGTVVNDGRIVGRVNLSGGGTLTNAGSIISHNGIAVTGSNLLVLEAGFGFSGYVIGGTSNNILELASGSSAGRVTGLGSQFKLFRHIIFDPGAQWFAAGSQSGLAGPIYGFAQRDTIELTGDTATGSSFVSGVLTLDLTGGGTATLNLPGTFTSASDFVVTNVFAGADVTVVGCFAAGTHILTADGEVPVEELTVGARVPTASDRLARIIWLGQQRATGPLVRVRAGAFGNYTPARDLLLSPDHAVFANGVLVPVRYFVNGSTIVQEPVDEVTYYHVELAAHDVILAEGLPCESYLDTGNRAAFAHFPDEAEFSCIVNADAQGEAQCSMNYATTRRHSNLLLPRRLPFAR
jgi:hypothetical protein